MFQVSLRLASKTIRRLTRFIHHPANRAQDAAPPLAAEQPGAAPSLVVPDDSSGPIAKELAILSAQEPPFGQCLRNQQLLFNYHGYGPKFCLPPEIYQNKDVLDVGCGLGASSALLISRGARFVWGIEPTFSDWWLENLKILPRTRFTRDVLKPEPFAGQRFDLVYSHFVTEHIGDLAYTFRVAHELLRPGGHLVSLHTNYYGPLGGHDHCFIWTEEGNVNKLRSQAPRCWESAQKCDTSLAFRQQAEKRHDWTVKQWTLTPDDCTKCLYYQRAQLWGHLLYQDAFPRNYPGDFFRCGIDGGLNKVTPFQLRQYVVEARFKVKTWILDPTENEPPPQLLEVFPRQDLMIGNILFVAQRVE
jgi:SAM-dependent methyltransferase